MSSFFSDLAKGAESLLETVDRQAAELSEDLKDTPHKKSLKDVQAASNRIKSRERYVSRRKTPNAEPSESPYEDTKEVWNSRDENIEETAHYNGSNEQTNLNEEEVGKENAEEQTTEELCEKEETREQEKDHHAVTRIDDTESKATIWKKDVYSSDQSVSYKTSEAQEQRITTLEKEIDLLDKQLVHMQEDLDAAQEALMNSQEVAATREQALKDELSDLETFQKAREKELHQALEEKGQQIDKLQTENAELRAQGFSFDEKLETLVLENKHLQEEVKRVKENADKAAELRDSGTLESQAEIQELNDIIERLKSENLHLRRDTEARTSSLEETNAELSSELANLQRKLDTLEMNSLNNDNTSALESYDALLEAQEAQRLTEKLLNEERQRCTSLQQQVESGKSEMKRLSKRNDEWEEKYHYEIKLRQDERMKHMDEMKKLKETNAQQDTSALESRLTNLSKSVISKQREIEVLNSENCALLQRLKGMELRLQGFGDNYEKVGQDLESGNLSYSAFHVGSGTSLRLRRRRDGTNSIAKLAPIAKHESLAKAVDSLDQFSLTMGNLLKKEPWARLAFISYIILLHIWVLYVLEFHTDEASRNLGTKSIVNDIVLPPGMSSSMQP